MDERTRSAVPRADVGRVILSAFEGRCAGFEEETAPLLVGSMAREAVGLEQRLNVAFEVNRTGGGRR
jgi:hypothetical protein